MESGTKLAHYEILSLLGKGGMGEVWRARDTKLGREVAIKTLPEEFAKDADRLARFEREAKLLASLNHPNIAAIYGFEEDGGTHFLVLELVEGDTLADQLKRGAISIEESLKLALQIAEALEAAHEKGVVHRDLKPASVKVTPDGKAKVLDFGLAKAFEGDTVDANLSQSPTLSMAATQQGIILGTAAYMSPEQARGETTDGRADIWAFAVVLFEMLTGKQLFNGPTLSDTLASVLKSTPDWKSLPDAIPSSIRRLLRRSLEKDRSLRLHHIGDVRIEILEAMAEPDRDSPLQDRGRPYTRVSMALTVVTVAVLTAVSVWALMRTGNESPPALASLSLPLPIGQTLVDPHVLQPGRYPPIALSDDGTRLVYAAAIDGNVPRLYVRDLAEFEARELPGTENAELPFFSPDGSRIGFWVNDTLYRVADDGSSPVSVGEIRSGIRGAVWGADDTMILGGINRGLLRTDAGGGALREVTETSAVRGEEYHAWPSLLPDKENVLFSMVTADSSSIGVFSLVSGDWEAVEGTEGATQARYLDSGHMVFFRDGSLFAAPFALPERVLTGPAVLVLDDVFEKGNAGHDIGYFSVSRNGTLVYVAGGTWTGENRIVSVDRDGIATPIIDEPGIYDWGVDVSRDGTQLTLTNNVTGNGNVWTHDLVRGTRNLLAEGSAINPVWSPDGEVLFAWFRGSSFEIYTTPADGSGEPEPLLERDYGQYPMSISSDGRLLAVREANPDTGDDIHILSLDGDGSLAPFLTTTSSEYHPSFSPDGQYLAYSSNVSGQYEVYVREVSGSGGQTTISNAGGHRPQWSPDGSELYYMNGSTMMAVSVDFEPTFQAGIPEPLFEGAFDQWYDVAPDGSFVMTTKPSAELTEINVVLNWFEELKERVPVP